ncbi:hypothetical protein [Nonomuraea wenchangensis]|uniref:DNA segregation ATPase FtsK/SpoIIIE, S-DNA-T family n=1 Tax=Nonomuraea wenchangensis TaxID=568860 RepID=A0A1I0LTX3_9ACTN|nr:hypothetical protein [Nonomuraea wenchangensis]SEU46707.1 hypothetical protein SAMN05421811_127126 [Nonomuraea wenchangensis]
MTATPTETDTTRAAVPTSEAVLAAAGRAPDRDFPLGGEMNRAAITLWGKSRIGLAPVGVIAGLAAAGHAMHENAANPLIGVVIPAAALAAALTKHRVRAWLAAAPWRRTWATGCLAAAAASTSTVAVHGLHGNLAALVAAGSLLAAPWWWANRWVPRRAWEAPARHGKPDAAGEQPSAQTATEGAQPVQAAPTHPAIEAARHPHQDRWDNTLGKHELAGTTLEEPQTVLDHKGEPNGAAFVINGSDARVSWTKIFQRLSDIYATYDAPNVEKLVHVERHQGWETRARLVILERDPFAEVIEWSRPMLDDKGTVPFAVYPDGSGWAPYTLYVPGWGTPHDMVVGETGGGKGGGLRLIAIETLAFGSRLVLMDPHLTGALEDCTGLVRNPLSTPQEILAGMRGIEAALEERIIMRAELGKERFGPEFGHNILHAMVDETSQVMTMDKEIGRILGRVYREGRKFYVKGSLADQSTAFGDLLGHSGAVIRDQAQGGNTILYRMSPQEGRRTNPGVPLPKPPHELPQWINEDLKIRATGVGYVLGGSSRALMSRTQWVPSEAFAAWCPPVERQVLDDRTEEAFERGFERAMGRMTGDEGQPSRDRDRDEGAAGGKVTALYPQSDPDEDERLTRRLLEFLHDQGGHATRAQISDAGICPATKAHRLLTELEKSGEVTQPQRGEFRLRAS